MSAFVEQEVQFKEAHVPELIAAIQEVLAERGLKNVSFSGVRHSKAGERLKGYKGDLRPETANVIIPGSNISASSNDWGWSFEGGKCKAIISEFDRSSYSSVEAKIKQRYAEKVVAKAAKKAGYTVERAKDGGKVKLTLKKGGW